MNKHKIDTKELRKLKDNFLKQELNTIELIYKSVGGNTIRAYRNNKIYKPLCLYRFWASQYLETNKEKIINCNNFNDLHEKAFKDLRKFWKKNENEELKLYLAYKLIDLTFKFIPLWKELNKDKKNWYCKNINVPLDKYSLSLIGENLKKDEKINKKKIPKNASMSFVGEDKKMYNSLQMKVKEICELYKITPLEFDLWAWDNQHQQKGLPKEIEDCKK